jgi:WXG100 family type VII secretion target
VNRLTVDSSDLRAQSGQVRAGASDVSETLTRLTGQIADLAGRWEGSASQAFQARWQEWQTGAQAVQQAMENMGVFLEQAAQAYEETEAGLSSSAANH